MSRYGQYLKGRGVDELRNIDIGIIICILSTLGWGVRALFSLKAHIGAHDERFGHTDQELRELKSNLVATARGSKEGRRELHNKIENGQRSTDGAIRHLEETLGDRLDKILEMLGSFESRQSTLESRVETIDERGTKYLQDLTQRNAERKKE